MFYPPFKWLVWAFVVNVAAIVGVTLLFNSLGVLR